jgi:hypothetical protein
MRNKAPQCNISSSSGYTRSTQARRGVRDEHTTPGVLMSERQRWQEEIYAWAAKPADRKASRNPCRPRGDRTSDAAVSSHACRTAGDLAPERQGAKGQGQQRADRAGVAAPGRYKLVATYGDRRVNRIVDVIACPAPVRSRGQDPGPLDPRVDRCRVEHVKPAASAATGSLPWSSRSPRTRRWQSRRQVWD